jgi:hypothetical protein|tara:strand:- start:564 stop:791 length:228 start_codon:yes stop_codon:yes gene_type:complete
MSDDLLKIHCTTTVTIRNTRKNKIYADETERDADIADPNTDTTINDIEQDVRVEISPKGLEALKRVMNQNNESNT